MLTLRGDDPAPVRYFGGAARYLDAARFRLVFGTIRSPGTLLDQVKALGHVVFCLDCHSRLGYPKAVRQLVTLIRRERIDVIHGHEELGGFLCGLAGVLARVPARIYHRHHDQSLPYDPDVGPQGSWRQRLRTRLHSANYRVLDGVAGRIAHRILTVSENHRQTVLTEHPSWGPKLGVALNGIQVPANLDDDRRRAGQIRAELQVPDRSPVLTLVARCNWRKGHAVLFDALRRLRSDHMIEPTLLVVGYGPLEAELRQIAQRLGLKRVQFVGAQANILPWFLACDVAVVPSLVEPFGLTAVEAMACSLPLVASRVGGLQEIVVDGETGLLVPPGDPAALADAVRTLLADRERATAMGRRGRDRYDREFTLAKMVRRWEQSYAELLAARRGSTY